MENNIDSLKMSLSIALDAKNNICPPAALCGDALVFYNSMTIEGIQFILKLSFFN